LTHEKVVPWESTPSLPFMIETVEQRISLSEFILMCVDHSRWHPLRSKGIM